MTDAPDFVIALPVEAVVCRAHGEFFRLAWPAGYPIFAVAAAHLVLGEDGSAELKQVVGEDSTRLNAAIAEFGPLCRLLTPEQRREAYLAAAKSPNWGERAICSRCRKWKLGARGHYQTPHGLQEHHVCIDCVSRLGCQGN